jgi:hypothetical protein
MSSELYYSNLGIKKPLDLRWVATRNLDDFRQYLYHAEKRMESRKYSYSYELKSINIKIDIPVNKDKPDLFTADSIFLDPTGIQQIKNKNDKLREFTVYNNISHRFIYGLFDDVYIPYEFIVKEVTLNNIEPLEVSEDAEDDALDILFESSSIYDSYDGESMDKRISIIGKNPKNRIITLNSVPEYDTFWIIYNAYILKRQREAIEKLAMHPKKNMLPLFNLLQTWEYTTWKEVKPIKPEKYFVLTDNTKNGCDEQRKFVEIAMGTPDIAILEGPPGSGKTTTLLELISQEIIRGKRILMVASTHVAVDNVIERIVAHKDYNKNKSLLNECGIVPLRIGDEGNVSEEVRKYCLNNLVTTEKKRLMEELKKVIQKGNHIKAQKNLYEDLIGDNEQSNEILKTLLVESANLICGTTIGMLRAPILEKSNSLEAVFDIVILDEASKTTFQEFLVPALYGKKWILSGDIKQLAPFVDRETVISNLRNLNGFTGKYGFIDKQICLSAFSVAKSYNNQDKKASKISKLIIQDINSLSEYSNRMNQQVKGLDDLFKNSDMGESSEISFNAIDKEPESLKEKLEIVGSNLIVTTKPLLKDVLPFMPLNLDVKLDEIDEIYERRKKAYIGSKNYESLSNNIQHWEEQIEWRLSRLYELKNSDPKYEKLKFEIKMLLPYFNQEGGRIVSKKKTRAEVVEQDIHRIRRIALPSILELLQNGYEADEYNTFDKINEIALYSGLSYGKKHQKILNDRHVLLSYQHRMHPDISEFPRENIYDGNALKDANDIEDKRSWSYDYKYPARTVWIDIKPDLEKYSDKKTSYNLAEVDEIITQLKEFMDWTKDNPCNENNGYWSIALLSFYKGQSKKFSEYLQQIKHEYDLIGSFNDYTSRKYNVILKISTVDRFQGHEADIVFLSFVRARRSSLGFLDNTNSLNVALTRARYQLVIVGDKQKFAKSKTLILSSLAKNTIEGPIRYR